jgi:hypothetical protein
MGNFQNYDRYANGLLKTTKAYFRKELYFTKKTADGSQPDAVCD